MKMAVFTCKLCGRTYEGVPPTVPDFAPEEVARRRQAWLEADEKLSKAPDNEHLERAYMKAWFAYGETMPRGVESLPEGITTRTGKFGGGSYFACANPEGCNQAKVSVEQPPRAPAEHIPTFRCETCNARVAHSHAEEHRRYNCQPGLHQPPQDTE